MNPQRLVEVAESYLGKEELAGNMGWKDAQFEAKMRTVGWKASHSWCCYFMELVAKEAFRDDVERVKVFDKLFQPSCTATYANFAGSSMFRTMQVPKVGALAVWRYGNSWQGHIGLVTKVLGDRMETIEGNTNQAGSREGAFVARKKRSSVIPLANGRGLNLIGFIYLC